MKEKYSPERMQLHFYFTRFVRHMNALGLVADGERVKDMRIIAICHCSKVHENNGAMKFVFYQKKLDTASGRHRERVKKAKQTRHKLFIALMNKKNLQVIRKTNHDITQCI